MRFRLLTLAVACTTVATLASDALASYCGLTGHLVAHSTSVQKHCGDGSGCNSGCQQWTCRQITKTCTRTRFEKVCETKTKTIVETVYENKVLQDVERIAETQYRQEPFTYTRTVLEPVTREVNYTVNRPVVDMVAREVRCVEHVPSYETRKRSIPYTTYRTEYDVRTRTIQFSVPRVVEFTRTISVPCGHWDIHVEEHPGPEICEYKQEPGCWVDGCCEKESCQKDCCQKENGCHYQPGKCHVVKKQCPPIKVCKRVWVPRIEQRTVCCQRVEYDLQSREEQYTVERRVPEYHSYDQEYTVCRMVPVTRTHTERYPVTRYVPEPRVKTITCTVGRTVTETGMRTVPFTTYREVPVTRNVCVARQVPREVCYTVERCIPRVETYEVPVTIYSPACPCNGCNGCGDGCGCGDACQKSESCQKSGCGSDSCQKSGCGKCEGKKDEKCQKSCLVNPSVETEAIPVSLRVETEVPAEAVNEELASRHFATGMEYYRGNRFEEAAGEFAAASAAAPGEAKYVYFHALALHQAGKMDEANKLLAIAVEMENDAPIQNWGKLMERVQGAPRMWLEAAR